MSDDLDARYTPRPLICCCRNGARPLPNGMVYINAGCKIHGITTSVITNARIPSREMSLPAHATRPGQGMWHHVAEGE